MFNIELYVRRVFTMNNCDGLIPEGVVDSEFFLNVARHTLRQNQTLRMCKLNFAKKGLETSAEIAEFLGPCAGAG